MPFMIFMVNQIPWFAETSSSNPVTLYTAEFITLKGVSCNPVKNSVNGYLVVRLIKGSDIFNSPLFPHFILSAAA